jgi:carbonic anhydrase
MTGEEVEADFPMKKFLTFFSFTILVFSANGVEPRLKPEEALSKLLEGNERFVQDRLLHPNQSQMRREAIVAKQRPFAVVLGCSDSRVPPVVVFDQGMGDIFTIRVAGNVVGPLEMESALFSVLVNGSSVLMVLGHENCGAVIATVENQTKDIIPLIGALIADNLQGYTKIKGFTVEEAIKKNAIAVSKTIKSQPKIKSAIKDGLLKVVAAYYHLESGKVEVLDDENLITKGVH